MISVLPRERTVHSQVQNYVDEWKPFGNPVRSKGSRAWLPGSTPSSQESSTLSPANSFSFGGSVSQPIKWMSHFLQTVILRIKWLHIKPLEQSLGYGRCLVSVNPSIFFICRYSFWKILFLWGGGICICTCVSTHMNMHREARDQHQVVPSVTPHLIFLSCLYLCMCVGMCAHACLPPSMYI